MPKSRSKVYDWLSEKLGNPVMGSKKMDAIRELEKEERELESRGHEMLEKQESGEDYPAEWHKVRRPEKM
jgi:hypothetical protein